MIFAILTHCLNKTDIINYSVRTKGRWFCEDKCLAGFFPLAPLDDWERSIGGSNPRNVAEEVPKKNVLLVSVCIGLSDFKVCKDVLRGDGRSRKIVGIGRSVERVVEERFRNVRFIVCICKAGRVSNGSDKPSVPGMRS